MSDPSSAGDPPIAKTMIIVGVITLLVVALIAFGVLGGDDEHDSTGGAASGSSSGATSGAECGGPYVDLPTEDAIRKAEVAHAPWRIGREDDQLFPTTLDFNPSRVTFEIDDGTVTTALCG